MTKEEAYKKLCVVLYNSIKEKLKAVNELNIDSFHLFLFKRRDLL